MEKHVEFPERLTAAWLRGKYLEGAISPEETIREMIRRAERDADNPIWIAPPSLERAKPYLERLADIKPEDAPLWGVPFAIKDNIDLEGVPTTAACPGFAYVPEASATVVQRLIDAGAIPLGKTNLDQFATGLVGTRSPYGETRNALKDEYISGGSSSGSAVAVARGHAAFALGTDTAGSGRVPAALHGLVGWKPSVGAWPTKGVVPACASLDCVTVFANELEDALAVDRAVRGRDERDPWSRDVPMAAAAAPRKLLLPRGPLSFYGPHADEYARAWEAAAARLETLGWPVERIDASLFEEAAAILYDGPWIAERWAALGGFVDAHPGETFPVTERILRSGASEALTAASAFAAMHKLQRFKLEAKRLLRDAVLAFPTAGGTYTREQVRERPVETNSDMGKYTNHCNLLDLCGIAVPAGFAAPDLPFGITLFALADQEHLAFGAAAHFAGAAEAVTAGAASGEATAETVAQSEPTTLVAVCGLHMRGYPLERQMLACGARFVEEAETAKAYRFVRLPTTPAKPGLVKRREGGASVRLELWEMPLSAFGGFAASIPAPLGIGKVELADGREVPGFVCEAYAAEAEGAEDITAAGSWRIAAPIVPPPSSPSA